MTSIVPLCKAPFTKLQAYPDTPSSSICSIDHSYQKLARRSVVYRPDPVHGGINYILSSKSSVEVECHLFLSMLS